MDHFLLMTYNIRNMHGDEGLHAWDNRKAHVAALIAARSPDVFCVQEAFWPQMEYLSDRVPGYAGFGVGRDDGAREGEFSAVFYNTARFSLVDGATCWLSETPDRPSIGWDATHSRICTKAVLAPRDGGAAVCVASLHLDHKGVLARRNSVRLLRELFSAEAEKYQCFIAGDYNSRPDSEPFQLMNQPPFYDARTTADEFSDYASCNGFEPSELRLGSGPIDHVFYSKGALRPVIAEILAVKRGGQFPSDHFPLLCTFSAEAL